jgi:hypothetical protein
MHKKIQKYSQNYAIVLGLLTWALNISTATSAEVSQGSLETNYNPKVELVHLTHEPSKSSSTCMVSSQQIRGEDPVLHQDRTIDLKIFMPHPARQNIGSVIIVPPIYGDTPLDQWDAQSFCEAGLYTALIDSWEYYNDPGIDWQSHDRATLRAVTAIRHTVEFIQHLHAGPMGILGTSLGAMTSSLALSIEPRLSTAVLIVAGGPNHTILAESALTEAQKLKEERLRVYNLSSDAQYDQKLAESIQFDTLNYASQSTQKNLWMFIATNDQTIPTPTQWQLWQAWNHPKFTEAHLGHVEMVVYTYTFWNHRIRDYFLQHLTLPSS